MIIEYSSICLNKDNYREKIREARAAAVAAGFEFGIQIHNSIDEPFLRILGELRGEIEFSAHSPLLAKYFLNLASGDMAHIKPSLDDAVSGLDAFGTDLFFFHGFFLTDKPILHDMKNYRRAMAASIGPEFSLNGSFIMDPAFFETERYAAMKEVFRKNLALARELYPHLIVAVENDFVGIGSGLQRPREIIELARDLWFDTGHFWCASLVHGFDFYEETARVLNSVRVHGVHVNNNLMTRRDPLEGMRDSHTHFYIESEQRLKPLVRSIADRGIPRLTLEIVDGDIRDLEIVLDWLG
ncbi:MAG: hypothetical protein KA369_13310 [Spirochaetes bacterium]|nr:hypothetical protein [Spirochaetota bacterium]